MRHLIGIVVLGFGVQAIASGQVPGTRFELADDKLGGALWRIAVATHTKIGFESVEFSQVFGRIATVPEFSIPSRDEALDTAVDGDSRYEWRAVGDVVLVRPKTAWNDPADPFNRSVRNLRVEKATSLGVLSGIRDFIYTSRFAVPEGPRGIPVSFEVQSGTVIDLLNRLTESAESVLWVGAYRPNPQPGQRYPKWDLQLQLLDPTHLHGATQSYPPRVPM